MDPGSPLYSQQYKRNHPRQNIDIAGRDINAGRHILFY